jgi:hypothetical protein
MLSSLEALDMLWRISFSPSWFSAPKLEMEYIRLGKVDFRSLIGWFNFSSSMVLLLISNGLSWDETRAVMMPMPIKKRMREAIKKPNMLASRYLKKLFMVIYFCRITEQY